MSFDKNNIYKICKDTPGLGEIKNKVQGHLIHCFENEQICMALCHSDICTAVIFFPRCSKVEKQS